MRRIGKGILVLALTPALSITVSAEVDPSKLPREVGDESSRVARLEPWISKSVPPKTRHSLAKAYELAATRLRNRSECQRLFDDLGADGLEVLAKSLYYRAALLREQTICRQASAFTQVGGRVTRICRSFGRLPENQAAVVLIHEALHQAGMSEKPQDPKALDSPQINQLVSDRCEL